MKKKSVLNRMVCIVLSLGLILSSFGNSPQNEVKASSEVQEVTLGLKSSKVPNEFTHSTLTEEYQGTSSAPVRYSYKAYVNGSSTAITDVCSFTGTNASSWNQGKATSSYIIPAGTIFYEYDTTTSAPKVNGKQLKLTKEFRIVYEDGAWKEVEAEIQGVTLALKNPKVPNEFTHSALTEEYQGTSSAAVRYCYKAYVNGSSTAITDVVSFTGANASGWNQGKATSSYIIPAGTIFYEYDTTTSAAKVNGKKLKLTEEFKIVYEDGAWKQVKAEKQGVTLELQSTGEEWLFGHSELTEEYQGTSSAPVRYRYDAYVDGESTAVIDWMSFSGTKTNKWSNTFKKAPTTSYVIPEGTIFYQYDPNSGKDIKDGKQMELTEEFRVVYEDGAWKQVQPQSVKLELQSTGEEWVFSHSQLTEEYQGTSSAPVRYRYKAYVDGASETVTDWMSFLGAKTSKWSNTFVKAPTTSYVIPEGTVFYQYDPNSGKDVENGKRLKLMEEFKVVYKDGAWEQVVNKPQNITLELQSTGDEWVFGHSELTEEYQGTSSAPVRYRYDAYVDGESTAVTDWMSFLGTKASKWSNTFVKGPTTSYVIPKGTVFYQYDPNSGADIKDGKQLILTEEFKVLYEDGVWKQEEPQGVTLELKSTGEEWVFNHSELTEEYQGTSSAPVRYRYDAYVDGASTRVTDWMSFLGTKTSKWSNTFKKVPTTSYVIPKGTIFYQYDPNSGNDVEDGKKLKLTEEFKLVYEGGEWKQQGGIQKRKVVLEYVETNAAGDYVFSYDNAEVKGTYIISSLTADGNELQNVVEIEFSESEGKAYIRSKQFSDKNLPKDSILIKAGTQLKNKATNEISVVQEQVYLTKVGNVWNEKSLEVNLAFSHIDANENWIFSFNELEMWKTGFYTLSSAIIDGNEVKNRVQIHFPTWTSNNPNVYSADLAYIYIQCFPNKVAPTNNFMIPAGTKLVNDTTGVEYTLAKQVYVENTTAGWDMKEYDVNLGFNKVDNSGNFVFTFDNSELSKSGYYRISSVTIDGISTKNVRIAFPSGEANKAYIYKADGFPPNVYPKNSIVIPKEAQLTSEKDGTVYTVANELQLKKVSSVWTHIKPVYNDVKLTFLYYDNIKAFIFRAEIVAGPDKGKNIADVYGNWPSPCPTGDVTYYTSERERTESISWYTNNKTEFYVAGNYSNWARQQTKIKIAKETIITPNLDTYSQVPIRIVNELNLQKETTYGLWRLVEDLNAPIKFYDVAVKATDAKANRLELKVTTSGGKEFNLTDIYGTGSSFYGPMVLYEPGEDPYTNKDVDYHLSGGKLVVNNIGLVTKDSIRIEAGTVLLARSSTCIVPLRIVNTFVLVRDDNDEWIVEADDEKITTSTTTQDTGKEEGKQQEGNEVLDQSVVTRNPVVKSEAENNGQQMINEVADYTMYIIGAVVGLCLLAALASWLIIVARKKKNSDKKEQ